MCQYFNHFSGFWYRILVAKLATSSVSVKTIYYSLLNIEKWAISHFFQTLLISHDLNIAQKPPCKTIEITNYPNKHPLNQVYDQNMILTTKCRFIMNERCVQEGVNSARYEISMLLIKPIDLNLC